MTDSTSDEAVNNVSAASWLETIPLATRQKQAVVRFTVTASIASLIVYLGFQNGEVEQKSAIWALVIFSWGLWLVWSALKTKTIQRYAVERIPLSTRSRAIKALPFWSLGFGGMFLIWGMQFHFDALAENWLFGLGFAPIALIGQFIFSYLKYETKLTSEAVKQKSRDAFIADQAPKQPSELESHFLKIWSIPIVRYLVAAGIFWFAFELAQTDHKNKWIFTIVVACMGIAVVHELILFLLGAGVVIGILVFGFNIVAALPVSIAVIIGALIIASAVKK